MKKTFKKTVEKIIMTKKTETMRMKTVQNKDSMETKEI